MQSRDDWAAASAAVRETLRRSFTAMAGSPNPLYRCLYRLAWLGSRARIWSDPRRRSEILTRLRHRRAHFQGATFTSANRYPLLFAAAAAFLRSRARVKLLSFGCSTGEEAFTLRRHLPEAEIVGVDINAWCLKRARRANTWPSVSFVHRRSAAFERLGGFDAVFCLAVFQRTENRNLPPGVPAAGFTFDRFESTLMVLDAKLKVGGLLVVCNADFAVEDTALGARFQAYPDPEIRESAIRTYFDRANAPRRGGRLPGRLFVKTG